jgi:CheY-like chemotaxis protein
MHKPPNDMLRGRHLFVAEDDYVIASDLVAELEQSGAEIIGPVGSVEDAQRVLAAEESISAAVLDINLLGQRVYPVADTLRERGIPFVFVTGYHDCMIPERYAGVPRLNKPVDTRALVQLLSRLGA